jgi:CheY-like chemotaxis protein
MDKHAKILVIDDDEVLLDLMARRLERMGLAADRADNGDQGMDLLGQNAYDPIVSDIYLPGATGLEILEAAKAKDPDLQVITITGGATINIAMQALEKGAFLYLTKPFDHLRVFDHVVAKALEYRCFLKGNGKPIHRPKRGQVEEEEPLSEDPAAQGATVINQLLEVLPLATLIIDSESKLSYANPTAKGLIQAGLSHQRLRNAIRASEGEDPQKKEPCNVAIGGRAYRLFSVELQGDQETLVVLQSLTLVPMGFKDAMEDRIASMKNGLSWLYQQRMHEQAFRVIRNLARQVDKLARMKYPLFGLDHDHFAELVDQDVGEAGNNLDQAVSVGMKWPKKG